MKPFLLTNLAILLVSGLCGCSGIASQPGYRITTTESKAQGMVAAANPLAAQAGVDILRQGGSAVDAAIAVQAMLGLVEPQSSGLGGGAFMLVYDPGTAEVWSYNGRETAPAGITPELFTDLETGEPLPYFEGIASGRSIGVPGAIAMLHMAHQDYGKLSWGVQMESAIKTAEEGFPVGQRMADIVSRMGQYVLNRQKAAREYFFLEDGETTIPAGYHRDNKLYAKTLRAIQRNPRALLEGPIAEAIIEAVREEPLPGTLTLADMAAYRPQKTRALCSTYRRNIVCGPQPPSSGPVTVQAILRIMENFDIPAIGRSPEGWHIFAEASALAYADRDKYVADPDFVEVETDRLLDGNYLRSRAALIEMDTAMGNVQAGNPSRFVRGKDATPDNPGTSHFTVVDRDGLTVSMTTTIEAPLGSQRMAAGFMLNNQLTDFSFRALDANGDPIANAPAAGKQPRSSMSPSIIFNPEGKFLFTTGSPGGNSIIAYTAKTIVGILDWGLSPQRAIELPNLISKNGELTVEARGIEDEKSNEIDRGSPAEEFGMAEETVEALAEKGHKVRRSRGEFSGIHIIYRNGDGRLIGGADPRREGVAIGL